MSPGVRLRVPAARAHCHAEHAQSTRPGSQGLGGGMEQSEAAAMWGDI